MQPFLGYMALAGCIFVLVVANSALMWKKFHPTPFLSTFLLVSSEVVSHLCIPYLTRAANCIFRPVHYTESF